VSEPRASAVLPGPPALETGAPRSCLARRARSLEGPPGGSGAPASGTCPPSAAGPRSPSAY